MAKSSLLPRSYQVKQSEERKYSIEDIVLRVTFSSIGFMVVLMGMSGIFFMSGIHATGEGAGLPGWIVVIGGIIFVISTREATRAFLGYLRDAIN